VQVHGFFTQQRDSETIRLSTFQLFLHLHEVCHFFSLFFKTKSLRITLLQCSPSFTLNNLLYTFLTLYLSRFTALLELPPPSSLCTMFSIVLPNCIPLKSWRSALLLNPICAWMQVILKFTLLAPSLGQTFELWCLANDKNLNHARKILKKQCQTFEVTHGLFHGWI
jgi:hypothetical protein